MPFDEIGNPIYDENTTAALSALQTENDALKAKYNNLFSAYSGGAPGALDPNRYIGQPADFEAAEVMQGQYNEWKNSYLPVAMKLRNQTTYANPELVNTEVNKAVGNVNQSFDTLAGVRSRFAQHSGIDLTPQQQAVNSRVNAYQKSASVVDAAARIRQTLSDRNKQIMQSGQANFQTQV